MTRMKRIGNIVDFRKKSFGLLRYVSYAYGTSKTQTDSSSCAPRHELEGNGSQSGINKDHLDYVGARTNYAFGKSSLDWAPGFINVPMQETDKVMFRVRKDLRELKPEHYAAEEFSFGLFDRSPMGVQRKIDKISLMRTQRKIEDKCKLEVAKAVLKVAGLEKGSWKQLCRRVVPNPLEITNQYDEFGRGNLSVKEVQSVLTLDAVFLASVLSFDLPSFAVHFPSLTSAKALKSARELIQVYSIDRILMRDLFKIENQIPLSLIRNVLRLLLETTGMGLDSAHRSLAESNLMTQLCWFTVSHFKSLLPGALSARGGGRIVPIEDFPFKTSDKFLECLYQVMTKKEPDVVKRQFGAGNMGRDFLMSGVPSAKELQKVGVQFRGHHGRSLKVEFESDGLKATLHLPTIAITDETEALWRNLLVYEQKYVAEEDFGLYLNLMDALIETTEDVILLKSGRFPVIIGKALGSNEDVVRIFNNTLIQNTFHSNKCKVWRSIFKQISDFYNSNPRKMYWEFKETFFDKPWVTLSVLTAAFLLFLTVLQTCYSHAEYHRVRQKIKAKLRRKSRKNQGSSLDSSPESPDSIPSPDSDWYCYFCRLLGCPSHAEIDQALYK